MTDIGLALTWAAISAASAIGLAAFGRAVAARRQEDDLAWQGGEVTLAYDCFWPRFDGLAHRSVKER